MSAAVMTTVPSDGLDAGVEGDVGTAGPELMSGDLLPRLTGRALKDV